MTAASTCNANTTTAQFQVYLRLRPAAVASQLYPALTTTTTGTGTTAERFLSVELNHEDEKALPTHITLNPPNDNRRRAVEKFGFTRVFEEESSQLDVFYGTGVVPLVQGVLGNQGDDGRDGLLATLGVTGSGKSHTILGSRNQRGLTQLALDLLFRSVSSNIQDSTLNHTLHASIAEMEPSEAHVMTAQGFLDTFYGDVPLGRAPSRSATPARVGPAHFIEHDLYPLLQGIACSSPNSLVRLVNTDHIFQAYAASRIPRHIPSYMAQTTSIGCKARRKPCNNSIADFDSKEISATPQSTTTKRPVRPSALPQVPDIGTTTVKCDPNAEYAILISMYEVYNDRIFDLLTPAVRTPTQKDYRRRPLLFKSTEHSTDRKVVAGLRKVICGNVKEALMVLEAGLHERRVAGTGSNSVSSRSHGFFCIEVKKRRRGGHDDVWSGSTLTIVDLAGSERARDTKTQGTTLAEAGKINESLMYLGQCLQMQSDTSQSQKTNIVPFRQCKLTELLFSNSFPSAITTPTNAHRPPQKAIMIVTADPLGDFNATSQILRYSALAREITVPRIPSITSTIMATMHREHEAAHAMPPPPTPAYRPISQSSSSSTDTRPVLNRYAPSFTSDGGHGMDRQTMEIAALEIARMSEELEHLRASLRAESQERQYLKDANLSLERQNLSLSARNATLEEKLLEIELEIREECWAEMEDRLRHEARQMKANWEVERERNEEFADAKVDALSKGLGALDMDENVDVSQAMETGNLRDTTGENKENEATFEALEVENQGLKKELKMLRAKMSEEQGDSSPLKSKKKAKKVLGENKSFMIEGLEEDGTLMSGPVRGGNLLGSVNGVNMPSFDGNGSPKKKVRVITGRRWVEDDGVD